MKRFIILLFIAAIISGRNAEHKNQVKEQGYIYRAALATSADVLELDDGRTIKLHNGDTLMLDETYILLLDPVNDGELLNYWDLETFELDNNLLS